MTVNLSDFIATGTSGTGLPLIYPDNCSLDDTVTGSSRGSAFGMIESIDYAPTEDGAVWFSFHYPTTMTSNQDLGMTLFYNLNGSDDGTKVKIQTDYWVIQDGQTPTSGSPTGINTDTIDVGTGNDNKRQSILLSSIPSGGLVVGATIILKFTRLATSATDNYSGTFQLLNGEIKPLQ